MFEIGPFAINTFGLMMAAGFFGAHFIIRRDYIRKGMHPELAGNAVFGALVGGIVGAKLYHFVTQGFDWGSLFSGVGFTWYGGLTGGAIAVVLVLKRSKQLQETDPERRLAPPLDSIALALPLGQAFGRVGCLLSGDGDYGPPTDAPWAMDFSNGVVPSVVDGVELLVHPTPIYDIVLLLIGFAVLMALRKRLDAAPGAMTGLALMVMAVERFITEFWRLTDVFSFKATPMGWESRSLQNIYDGLAFDGTLLMDGISEYQLWSLLLMAAGAVVLWRSLRKNAQERAG